ncbi:MAG TPA: aspartyl protease family protein [Gemmataceae bacterium]|jgi:hypothetical protein
MFSSRHVGLILVVAVLSGGTWLLARKPHDSPPKSANQATVYSISHLNNDVLMLDAIHGKTWILREIEDGMPTWLSLPKIDSDKEAAHLLRKSANPTGKDSKNHDTLSIDRTLKERGYIEVSLRRLRAGYLCVDLQIEGKKVLLAVDTAAPWTHLDSQRVKHLQLKWQPWNKESGKEKASPKIGSDYCEIAKLEIGGFTVGNLLIGSHDISDINDNLKFYLDPPIDGVLGSDVLTKLNALIDYSTTKLYFRSTEPQKR